MRVQKRDWWIIVERFRKQTGNPLVPAHFCLEYFGVCVPSLIDPFAAELLSLYWKLDGTNRLREPDEMFRQSALWVDACNLIDSEVNFIKREKMKENARKQS